MYPVASGDNFNLGAGEIEIYSKDGGNPTFHPRGLGRTPPRAPLSLVVKVLIEFSINPIFRAIDLNVVQFNTATFRIACWQR